MAGPDTPEADALRLPPPILLMSPGDLEVAERDAARLLGFARATGALFAGAGLGAPVGLLLREPTLFDADLLELVARLRDQGFDHWLGIHDALHVASTVGAHGAHLGFRSLPAKEARRALPNGVALGASLHAGDDSARCADLDYACLSPVHPTPYKSHPQPPLGWSGFAAERQRFDPPVWALGGLQPEDAAPAREHGADGVLLRSGVLGQSDAPARLERLLSAWEVQR
ncbi:MAG: thiamine phosphate synthase [Planctomycetota bacterium]|jgi:thiamine-phosphate diphosphorylase